MAHWMHELARRYREIRKKYDSDELMVVFDIDGTILDMRYLVCFVLCDFDRTHGTTWFHGLNPEEITVHENHVERFLEGRPLPPELKKEIMSYYLANRWSTEATLAAHHPFKGVLGVIRWFQLQPHTHVGLNTGRPELLREETLRSLNTLGAEHRVLFESDKLYMNPAGWEQGVGNAKVEGINRFSKKGYRVFAVVDNEPANIEAMSTADPEGEILFLHADTLFESKPRQTARTVEGTCYDITELVGERDLPRHVQFAWHGVNDLINLRHFVASPVSFGECDVREDPCGRIVLRDDSFEKRSWDSTEELLPLAEALDAFKKGGKGMKLDLKEGGPLVEAVLAHVAASGMEDDGLWFNSSIQWLEQEGFQRIARAHPKAVLQCPVDFLFPLILSVPEKAREILGMLASWGISRFSISWKTQSTRQIFNILSVRWGYEVNIYDVPDLESFLEAALLTPRSLTSDFNFPSWHYFGRGSGEGQRYHRYQVDPGSM